MDETFVKKRVLVVDDSPTNIRILAEALRDEYKITVATNGVDALDRAMAENQPDLVLLDIMMPEMDGYEVCRRLKADEKTKNIPVIFLTALNEEDDEMKGLNVGAVDYITKPLSLPIVKTRIRTHLQLKNYQDFLEDLVKQRTKELIETQLEIVYRLARAAEYRDNETGFHVKRMSHYSALLGAACGMNKAECELLYYASSMHDVGKIGIPDNILLKPGKLDDNEWVIMKSHTTIGAALLARHSSELLRTASTIALNHHEKWDGSGYPEGILGDKIPLEGRITALCDVFDALTSERPYKKAWSVEEAMTEINNQQGRHFDPELVKLFNKILPEILSVKKQFS